MPAITEDQCEHIHLTCANCDAGLVDIVLTEYDPSLAVKVRANCPFCGDSSFIKEVPGPYGRDGFAAHKPGQEDDPDAYVESTIIADEQVEGGITQITVVKARPDARPIYVRN